MPTKEPDNAASARVEGTLQAAEPDDLDFETAIEELEALVDRMEAGDLTLEASLIAYERGVKLTRHCQIALRDAELKVNKLSEDGRLEPMDPAALDDD